MSKLTPCYVLIPLAYNDGTRVSKREIKAIRFKIYTIFGGYTLEGIHEGAYRRDDTGQMQVEKLLRIRVDVPGADGIARMRELVIEIGRCLGQERMHFEVASGSKVELIWTGNRQ